MRTMKTVIRWECDRCKCDVQPPPKQKGVPGQSWGYVAPMYVHEADSQNPSMERAYETTAATLCPACMTALLTWLGGTDTTRPMDQNDLYPMRGVDVTA